MICESKRDGSRVTQRVVKYLGVAHTESEYETLHRLAKIELKALKEGSSQETIPNTRQGVPLSTIVETQRIVDGFYDVFGPMFDRLNLSSILSE
ncbi:MAG: hypothetical protein ACRDF4_09365, partial [Rhabdochlamydiaceae bacterium]